MSDQSLISVTPYCPETRTREELRAAGPEAELSVPGRVGDMNPMFRHGFRMLLFMLHYKLQQRGAMKFSRCLLAYLRGLHDSEAKSMKDWMLRSLRASPLWQARVLFDLGGRKALITWQRRYDVSLWKQPKPHAREVVHRDLSEDTPPKARYRTDRDGLFRWASISQASTKTKQASSLRSKAKPKDPREIKSLNKNPWPIEVTPADFQNCASIVIDDTHHAEQVQDLWHNIQSEHLDWHRQIVSVIDFLRLRFSGLLPPQDVIFAPP